ncbi:unnamed protein product [Protopolystoma xenopodis]|uniref:Uncharacterized protein n=1 Tax=Protopolystoma xenopodis TaxID=117903 RepID=A0A3S5CMG1_9PLAT|nr:unnamed protein product [Protopolystoma xenopodis]
MEQQKYSTRAISVWVVVSEIELDPLLPVSEAVLYTSTAASSVALARTAVNFLRSSQASPTLRIGIIFNPRNLSLLASTSNLTSDVFTLTRALYLAGEPALPIPITDSASPGVSATYHLDHMTARNLANKLLKEAGERITAINQTRGLVGRSIKELAVGVGFIVIFSEDK